MTQEIKNKVVVITGASSGNGAATTRRLAEYGAKLVLGARRLDRLQTLARELSLGDQAVVQTDVTQYEQVQRLVDHAVKTHGRIDVIINNAGVMPHSPLERCKGGAPRFLDSVDPQIVWSAPGLQARQVDEGSLVAES